MSLDTDGTCRFMLRLAANPKSFWPRVTLPPNASPAAEIASEFASRGASYVNRPGGVQANRTYLAVPRVRETGRPTTVGNERGSLRNDRTRPPSEEAVQNL